jgi:nitrate reductase (cytochrome), electron transfer subunit
MKSFSAFLFALCVIASPVVPAQTGDGLVNGLRGTAPLDKEPSAPAMPKMNNDDQKRTRAFATQPPVIPHQIENYQVDKNFNKCMSCHARDRVGDSQAPMVSVTHYTDRDNNFRAEISPRRYFCNQCHVPQMEVKVPVGNTYQDVSQLAAAKKGKAK